MSWILVIAGGMAGACLRHLTDRAVRARLGTGFPWGTLAANLTGCLVLGILAGAAGAAPEPVRLLVGTGACGALTTYSTFSYETLRLAETGARLPAAVNIGASVVAGMSAVIVGAALAQAVG